MLKQLAKETVINLSFDSSERRRKLTDGNISKFNDSTLKHIPVQP